jgi:lysozyme
MMPSNACLDLIRNSEGLQLKVYLDDAGNPTCGWGHKDASLKVGAEFSLAQCEAWLEEDVSTAAQEVTRLCGECTQGQFDALTDFVFNEGAGHLANSTLLKYHNHGQYSLAAAEFGRWKYAGHPPHVDEGLVKRRALETAMYLGHEFSA